MDLRRAAEIGYDLSPAPLQVLGFHAASRVGTLLFTSGQIPSLGDEAIKGKVGAEIDVETARRAAEICAINCLRAALAVVDASEIVRVVKLTGLVNVAPDFDETSTVINGATDILNVVFAGQPTHSRTAVGAVLPNNWAVEVEVILELS